MLFPQTASVLNEISVSDINKQPTEQKYFVEKVMPSNGFLKLT